MFPGLLLPLLDKCGIAADRTVQDHYYFGTQAQMRLIFNARLYIHVAAVIWTMSYVDICH